jgi:TolA-binding protein
VAALPDAPAPIAAKATAPVASSSAPPKVEKAEKAPSAADLLLEADAARYAGDFDRAAGTLETVRARFPGSDAAASAAFALGRIAFDVRHDLVAAGDWFDTYLRERPSGAYAREALGRALEARHRSGDATRAEQLAVRYLAAYPDGPHAKLARKLAGASP